MKFLFVFTLSILCIQSAFAESKNDCYVKYHEKSQELLLEKANADKIARNQESSISERSLAIAESQRLTNEIFVSLPITLQAIIDQAENENDFNCPIK